MRIAIFIPGYRVDQDDWCIPAFTNLTRELARHAEVHVFALRHPSYKRGYVVDEVQVHAVGAGRIGRRRLFGLSLIKLWVDTLKLFDRVHKQRHFDVVLGIWATESGWLAASSARRWGIPCAVHLAGGELVWWSSHRYGNHRRGIAGAMVDEALRQANLVTAPSKYMGDLLVSGYPSQTHKLRFWSPGVDTTMFAPPAQVCSTERPFTFLAVASLLPVKGIDILLQGAAALRRHHPDTLFKIVLAGDGPDRGFLQSLAYQLGLVGYVDFVGEIAHAKLPALYGEANCFVLTSLHEAQSLALLEGMSCGLPWIATKVGAASDVAMCPSGKQSGILLEGRKVNTLADALYKMAHMETGCLATKGANARDFIVHHYSLERKTFELLSCLASLTRQPGAVRIESPRPVTATVFVLIARLLGRTLRNSLTRRT